MSSDMEILLEALTDPPNLAEILAELKERERTTHETEKQTEKPVEC